MMQCFKLEQYPDHIRQLPNPHLGGRNERDIT